MTDDYGLDVETARTEFNACGYEVERYQKQLAAAFEALVGAAEQYGYACGRDVTEPVGAVVSRHNEEPA